ncbi:YbaK/EbsC family protein [Phycicoccus sp. Soil748]|uniref:YbaK/EbsC family protein n=1 Tax=Phycicoccus sp. Soil748 TaxID=1736397 RepID=UPI0009E974BD|nr:YbaK/EbsC family protein [Phycicoccus sp. Soil748]
MSQPEPAATPPGPVVAAPDPAPSPPASPASDAAPARDLRQHAGVQRVLAALAIHGVEPRVVVLPDAARTAAAAAAALGVTTAEIANSLVFRAHDEAGAVTPLLVLTSGAHRVDLVKVAELVDGIDHLDRADAEFVRAATGFAIGGVAPVGHPAPIPTVVDVSLSRYRHVWAAAGHSHTVYETTYEELLRVSGGHAIEVA